MIIKVDFIKNDIDNISELSNNEIMRSDSQVE